jgi:hypothetical protein
MPDTPQSSSVLQLQYTNGLDPMPGDRVSDRDGRLGIVMDVRSGDEAILDGELAVKWDDGVVTFNYAIAGEFLLVSRRHI